MRHLGQPPPAYECPVSFWRFAGPILVGNLAAWGAVALTGQVLADAHPTTQKTARIVAGLGTFWLVGGLSWVALGRQGTQKALAGFGRQR